MLEVVRKHPEFRRLWLAQVISHAGNWLNRVAILALIGHLSGGGAATATGALFAVELAVRLLPVAFIGPIAGPVADRVSRKFLMLASDVLRALVVLGYLLVREESDLGLLYALLVAQMSLSIFFESARSASVPNTVSPEDLHAAYVLSAATWSTMLAVGSMAGGLLFGVLGIRGIFIVDSLTFLVSALFIVRLKLPPTPAHPQPLRWGDVLLLTDIRRGLAHARERGVGLLLATKTFWGGAGGFLVILGVAGSRVFGGEGEPTRAGPTSLDEAAAVLASAGLATGFLYAARGLGTGLGPILAARYFGISDRSLLRQISSGFLLAVVGYTIFGFTHSLALALAAVTLAHMGGSTLWVSSTLGWQRAIDDAYRGRVFALEFLGMTLAFSAGGFVAGLVYDATGSVSATVWVTCGIVLVSGAAWTLLARRTPPPAATRSAEPGAERSGVPEA